MPTFGRSDNSLKNSFQITSGQAASIHKGKDKARPGCVPGPEF